MNTTLPHAVHPRSRPTKGYRGLGMEGFVARWYAKNTGRNLDEICRLADEIDRRLPGESLILEVAPGPGYLAIELAKRDHRVTGLDISHTFVQIARQKAQQAGVTVAFEHGDASAMPLAAGTFDFVVCRAAFKNFSRPVAALDEMHRVLRPGGTAMIVDLSKDATADDIRAEVDAMHAGWLNAAMIRLTFKHMLLKRAYRIEDFQRMAAESRFGSCQVRTEGIGLIVTLTK